MKYTRLILLVILLTIIFTGCQKGEVAPQNDYKIAIEQTKSRVAEAIALHTGVPSVKLEIAEVKILEYTGSKACKYSIPISGKYYHIDKYGDIGDFKRFEAYCDYYSEDEPIELFYAYLPDEPDKTIGTGIQEQQWDGSENKILYSE